MSLLLANWKLIVIAVLLILLGQMTRLYIDKRDDLKKRDDDREMKRATMKWAKGR